jgi:glycine dehydrogenase
MDALAELAALEAADGFVARHIGPSDSDIAAMLHAVGAATLDDLAARTVPPAIRTNQALDLPPPIDEAGVIAELRGLAAKNVLKKSLIGMGYHGTHTPPVILRNVMENPGWYTAYTPYQAEIAQGRLEALLNFQTMICDLTGMEIANASLLDEATAAAEAMAMAHAVSKTRSDVLAVATDLHPQTRAVLATRARPIGIRIVDVAPGDLAAIGAAQPFALVLQYPGTTGAVREVSPEIAEAHEVDALVIVCADPLALAVLTPPGEMGADVVVGSSQRFGVPMGFGGPHAGYLATRDAYKRHMPGRLVGVSLDAAGQPAMRLALQTREQHIRREKATSNICTNQALVALMVNIFMTVYGKIGLRELAKQNLAKTAYAADHFNKHAKVLFAGAPRFNEFVVETSEDPYAINSRLLGHKMVGGLPMKKFYPELGNAALWCCTELTTRSMIDTAVGVVAESERSVRTMKDVEPEEVTQ